MENETSDAQPKCQGPLQLLSPLFLMTSTTKQMRPNGRGGDWTRKDKDKEKDQAYKDQDEDKD